MKILHLLTSGESGGIETLCREFGKHSKYDNGFCFLQHGGQICRQMSEMGMTVYDLSDIPHKFSWKKLKKLRMIQTQYDILIVHHGDPFLKGYYILLRLISRKKSLTMVHSCYGDKSQVRHSGLKLVVHDCIFQFCFDVSDRVVFVSKAGMESCLSKYKIERGKCRLVYNGIATEILDKGKKAEFCFKQPYVITYIGRLSGEKGVDLLLRAAALIKNSYNIQLEIIGDGKERRDLEQLAIELDISDRTVFHGQQLEIAPYLQRTAVFVYPSTCQEVFGISLVEAMAYGIPCIANPVGGIPEIIRNGENGFLTDDISDQAIADKICEVLARYENGTIDSLKECAYKTAESFSIINTCKKMEELIDSLY